MAGPTKKKQQREEKNDEQSAFSAAANSQYNTITPMIDAEYCRFHHPHKGVSIHCSTKSEQFHALFAEFAEKGLRDKMIAELRRYAETIDARWNGVLEEALARADQKESSLNP